MALRLIADDLTGALDTAARFVPVYGPIPTYLSTIPDMSPTSLAVDIAEKNGITVVGFIRADRLNVYTHTGRIRP